jgi:hypothetical protein
MSLASKFEFRGKKKKKITFCCAVAVIAVALVTLPDDSWALESSNRRPPLSWIPMPDTASLVLIWLGGWFVALFATEESDYRWAGIVGIAVSLMLGALMFAAHV